MMLSNLMRPAVMSCSVPTYIIVQRRWRSRYFSRYVGPRLRTTANSLGKPNEQFPHRWRTYLVHIVCMLESIHTKSITDRLVKAQSAFVRNHSFESAIRKVRADRRFHQRLFS